ncbi:UNVERIFIED_CONTAM: hypothetical protein FKN15_058226 [Acipenser sinensis]
MAQGPKDQGGVGTADPDDDSPNMIVYRKAHSIGAGLRNVSFSKLFEPQTLSICICQPPY